MGRQQREPLSNARALCVVVVVDDDGPLGAQALHEVLFVDQPFETLVRDQIPGHQVDPELVRLDDGATTREEVHELLAGDHEELALRQGWLA